MRLRAGTSGFSYKEWKGPFYPETLPATKMLAYYAERLSTVEINSTFYRMPKASTLEGWAEKVPEDFVFILKAPRKITHSARLKDATDSVTYLWSVARTLGAHLGPILFQLPPFLKKDVARLRDFLDTLPEGMRAAFEFRHESWFDDETYRVLSDGGQALCLAESEKASAPEPVCTTDWGYLRLRREHYEDAALRAWRNAIESQPWHEAFVFFKHEDEGAAPRLARRLLSLE